MNKYNYVVMTALAISMIFTADAKPGASVQKKQAHKGSLVTSFAPKIANKTDLWIDQSVTNLPLEAKVLLIQLFAPASSKGAAKSTQEFMQKVQADAEINKAFTTFFENFQSFMMLLMEKVQKKVESVKSKLSEKEFEKFEKDIAEKFQSYMQELMELVIYIHYKKLYDHIAAIDESVLYYMADEDGSELPADKRTKLLPNPNK